MFFVEFQITNKKIKIYYCKPFTSNQVIVLIQKCVKSPFKHFLACYCALKLSTTQAQYFYNIDKFQLK